MDIAESNCSINMQLNFAQLLRNLLTPDAYFYDVEKMIWEQFGGKVKICSPRDTMKKKRYFIVILFMRYSRQWCARWTGDEENY